MHHPAFSRRGGVGGDRGGCEARTEGILRTCRRWHGEGPSHGLKWYGRWGLLAEGCVCRCVDVCGQDSDSRGGAPACVPV